VVPGSRVTDPGFFPPGSAAREVGVITVTFSPSPNLGVGIVDPLGVLTGLGTVGRGGGTGCVDVKGPGLGAVDVTGLGGAPRGVFGGDADGVGVEDDGAGCDPPADVLEEAVDSEERGPAGTGAVGGGCESAGGLGGMVGLVAAVSTGA